MNRVDLRQTFSADFVAPEFASCSSFADFASSADWTDLFAFGNVDSEYELNS